MNPVARKRWKVTDKLPPWLEVTTEPPLAKGKRSRLSGLMRNGTNWPRVRINYAYLEQIKIRLAEIPYRRYPVLDDLNVSIMPWSRSGYVDMRFYREGRSTGKGIIVHIHKWKAFYAAMAEADRAIDRLREDGWIESIEEQTEAIAKQLHVEDEFIAGRRQARVKDPTFTLPTFAVAVVGSMPSTSAMPTRSAGQP